MIVGLEWDLTIISSELAALVETEVQRYLDDKSPKYRNEYAVNKLEIYSSLPAREDITDKFTTIRLGLGRRGHVFHVMEFTQSLSGHVWTAYSIDVTFARVAYEFSK